MTKWLSPDKAPKDGTKIIANFRNHNVIVVACWNGADKDWVAAVPNVEPYNGVWNDWYFENEHFADVDLIGWREL